MSTSRLLAAVGGLLLVTASSAQEAPALGVAIDPDDLERLDYVVMPDGSGLPSGSGTAREGAVLYAEHCLACHGDEGEGGINDQLAGGHGTIDAGLPVKTVGSYWPYATTIFDYIRRAMPYQQPGSLTNDEIYALTAYLLNINGIVADEERLDAATLPAVRMPNRDNFVWAYAPAGRPDD
jgi:cytochrome c